MEQSPWKGSSCSAVYAVGVHYCINERSLLVPVLRQMSSHLHIRFFSTHINPLNLIFFYIIRNIQFIPHRKHIKLPLLR
jgi:hypothetical protein